MDIVILFPESTLTKERKSVDFEHLYKRIRNLISILQNQILKKIYFCTIEKIVHT